jgi:hypothetical protein
MPDLDANKPIFDRATLERLIPRHASNAFTRLQRRLDRRDLERTVRDLMAQIAQEAPALAAPQAQQPEASASALLDTMPASPDPIAPLPQPPSDVKAGPGRTRGSTMIPMETFVAEYPWRYEALKRRLERRPELQEMGRQFTPEISTKTLGRYLGKCPHLRQLYPLRYD